MTQILFHIHRTPKGNPSIFEKGKEYNTKPMNDFWSFYDNYHPNITYDDINLISPAKYSHYCVERNEIHPVGLKFLSETIKESGMFIRELIFEEIREKNFSALPSRRSCIWLTEKSKVDFWFNWLNDKTSDYYSIEMECLGIFHKGNQSFLDSDIVGYKEYCLNATAYWSGTNINIHDNNEIIFEGKMNILNVNKIFS